MHCSYFQFSILKIHKICYGWQIDLKLAGFIELPFLYQSWPDLCIVPTGFYESFNVHVFPKCGHNFVRT